ncbi:MAG: hypothetical protein Q8P66_01730 [Candidatus Colwellbacteria bacterium]|nr:hypothetical protein [Candidatus Colwellbacteria bacterium]
MNRRTLAVIVVIGLVTLIAGMVFVLRLDENDKTVSDGREGGELIVSRLPTSWQLIENTKLKYAFEVPPSWEVQLVVEDVEARFKTDAVRAEVTAYGYSNLDNVSLEEWIKSVNPTEVSRTIKEQRDGLKYITRETAESYEGGELRSITIDESYVLGILFQVKDKILDIRCSVAGPEYRSMILTCEEIVKSLQFIQ